MKFFLFFIFLGISAFANAKAHQFPTETNDAIIQYSNPIRSEEIPSGKFIEHESFPSLSHSIHLEGGGGGAAAAGGNVSLISHHSIFGSATQMEEKYSAVGVLAVIVVVLLLEQIFELLHEQTDDTPFQYMVSAIEKEMMIGK